jgi:hypothetical protein
VSYEVTFRWPTDEGSVKFRVGSIWNGDTALIFTSQDLESLTNEVVTEICDWFREHAQDIGFIETVLERLSYGQYYQEDESQLLGIYWGTGDAITEQECLQALENLDNVRRSSKLRKPSPQRKPKPGYVYLIKADNGMYKIGKAQRPDERIKALGIQLPYDVETIALIETPDAAGLEADLHAQFADKRLKGEWFDLVTADLDHLRRLAEEQDDTAQST